MKESRIAPAEAESRQLGLARAAGGVERPLTWNPDLVEKLQELLLSGPPGNGDLEQELTTLAEEFQDAVYSELIYLLSHIRFEPGEARAHWQKIGELRRTMQQGLGTPVDPRVALVSYFLEDHPRLENPTVIEMRLFEEAREMAYRDELTGLHNFRYFREFLNYEVSRSNQYDGGLSVILIDIDDFKSYNDNLGHQEGNEALAEVARLITESVREVDLAARFGGEEFVVVAPETPKLGARELACRIRERIEEQEFAGEAAQPGGRLTVTLGVATYPADAAGADELVHRADQALYLGKSSGKNQVCLFGNNRRSYRRFATSLEGTVRFGGEEAGVTTIDISEGGVRFSGTLQLPLGGLVELRLRLAEPGGEVSLAGRVIQSSVGATGRCEAAVRTIEIGARDRLRLVAALEEIATRL